MKMKIAMYDLEGHLLEVFDVNTVVELEQQLDVPQGSINKCIMGLHLQSKGRQFRLLKNKSHAIVKIGDVHKLTIGQSNKAVQKYYNGKYICSYGSLTDASDKNKIKVVNICKACSGTNKTAGGFEWKYID